MTFYYETAVLWLLFTFTPLFSPRFKKLMTASDYIGWFMNILLYVALTVALYSNNVYDKRDSKYDPILILAIILVLMDKLTPILNTFKYANWFVVINHIILLVLAVILIVLNGIIDNKVALFMYIFVVIYYLFYLIYKFVSKNDSDSKSDY
jgi:hypothetical protein